MSLNCSRQRDGYGEHPSAQDHTARKGDKFNIMRDYGSVKFELLNPGFPPSMLNVTYFKVQMKPGKTRVRFEGLPDEFLSSIGITQKTAVATFKMSGKKEPVFFFARAKRKRILAEEFIKVQSKTWIIGTVTSRS